MLFLCVCVCVCVCVYVRQTERWGHDLKLSLPLLYSSSSSLKTFVSGGVAISASNPERDQ